MRYRNDIEAESFWQELHRVLIGAPIFPCRSCRFRAGCRIHSDLHSDPIIPRRDSILHAVTIETLARANGEGKLLIHAREKNISIFVAIRLLTTNAQVWLNIS